MSEPSSEPSEAAAPADPRAAALDAAIAAWIDGHVRNSPIAEATAAWNHLVAVALPRLRDAILKEA